MFLLESCRAARRRLRKTESVVRRRSPPRGFSCSNRHASDRPPHYFAPFCTGRMLMRPDNRGIEKQMLQVGVAAQRFAEALPNASFAPTVVTLKNRVPVAKTLGQVAPWGTGLRNPKHGVHKQPV